MIARVENKEIYNQTISVNWLGSKGIITAFTKKLTEFIGSNLVRFDESFLFNLAHPARHHESFPKFFNLNTSSYLEFEPYEGSPFVEKIRLPIPVFYETISNQVASYINPNPILVKAYSSQIDLFKGLSSLTNGLNMDAILYPRSNSSSFIRILSKDHGILVNDSTEPILRHIK